MCLHQENASCEHPAVHGLHHQASAGHCDPVVRRLQSVPPPAHHWDQVWNDQADRHRPSDCSGHGVSPTNTKAVRLHYVCFWLNNFTLFLCSYLHAKSIIHRDLKSNSILLKHSTWWCPNIYLYSLFHCCFVVVSHEFKHCCHLSKMHSKSKSAVIFSICRQWIHFKYVWE